MTKEYKELEIIYNALNGATSKLSFFILCLLAFIFHHYRKVSYNFYKISRFGHIASKLQLQSDKHFNTTFTIILKTR